MNVPVRVMNHKLDVFAFGKFKGKTVRHVIEHEPSYILWLSENKVVTFSREILDNAGDEFSNELSDVGGWDRDAQN